jgi:hypothetical protein
MKTYWKKIKKPRLEIERAPYADSPREWTNLGYFITVDRDYNSPDKNEQLESIVKKTGEIAENLEDHIKRITKRIKEETGEKVLKIYPISKYEHSDVSYALGVRKGFDYSNNGFYIITDKTQKEVGTPKKLFEKVINDELDLYNKWAIGEVYCYALWDKNGTYEDGSSGFYDIEDIRAELPEEWKNENLEDYLINNQ